MFEKISVTGEQVINTLREVAAERPDHVYVTPANADNNGGCYYVHTDNDGNASPGCIVGTVLHKLGVPLSELEAREHRGAYTILPELLDITGPAEIAYAARNILSTAQDNQDGTWDCPRMTWGEAAERAISVNLSLVAA